jgi:hypothetical protein
MLGMDQVVITQLRLSEEYHLSLALWVPPVECIPHQLLLGVVAVAVAGPMEMLWGTVPGYLLLQPVEDCFQLKRCLVRTLHIRLL